MPTDLGDSGDVRFGFQYSHRAFVTKRCRKAWSLRSRNRYVAAGTSRRTHRRFQAIRARASASKTGIPMICQTGSMDEARAAEVMAESAAVLRKAGARFVYLHGSRASGQSC